MSRQHESCFSRVKKSISPVTIVLAVLLIISLGVIVCLLSDGRGTGTPEYPHPKQTPPAEKLTDSIDLPGFGELHFKAGRTEQNLSVPNPAQNFCWFKVSLLLDDGTVLWTSDMIAPGEESGKAVLSTVLEEGEYTDAVLKYECFADEAGQNALNGAETSLTIIVH